MSVPRMHSVVLDCPDPAGLAAFYARLLDWRIGDAEHPEDDWVTIVAPDGTMIDFQHVPDYQPPTWPTGDRPQMLHLDFDVDDPDAAQERAVGLGATLLDVQKTFRVYADPVGHPFCLCG